MSQTAVVVQGLVQPDGTLVVEEKVPLPAGRVRVTVEPAAVSATTQDPFLARMEAIWAGQRARGHVPRSVEEVEREDLQGIQGLQALRVTVAMPPAVADQRIAPEAVEHDVVITRS